MAIYKLYSEVFAKTVNIVGMPHPRRPRGSQSGWEKRREESFQVRTKELLGTDSHRTFSKNSSSCQLPIGHKKCFVLLCPIGEQFLLSSFRELVREGYCLTTLARCVHQACACKGNFLFSTFLTRNEGTIDESEKRLGCYQQEQILFLSHRSIS